MSEPAVHNFSLVPNDIYRTTFQLHGHSLVGALLLKEQAPFQDGVVTH